jgi:tRNA (guanine-N7-)-methyltransferase
MRENRKTRPVSMTPPKAVNDPDFRYTESYNIYWDKIKNLTPEMQGTAYGDHDTEAHRGKWREQFALLKKEDTQKEVKDRLPLHVEVGCNAGHVSLEWAKQNPHQLFIGIDWKFKMIFKFAEKIQKNALRNMIAFRANAERLPQMFAEGEIDFLHMFFPDPWPKAAQMKNRTASAKWLRTIAPLIHHDGLFHLKTDHAGYFEFILEEVAKVTDIFETVEMTKDLHAGNPNARLLQIPEVTLFERLFIKDGLPIHSIKLRPIQKAI